MSFRQRLGYWLLRRSPPVWDVAFLNTETAIDAVHLAQQMTPNERGIWLAQGRVLLACRA